MTNYIFRTIILLTLVFAAIRPLTSTVGSEGLPEPEVNQGIVFPDAGISNKLKEVFTARFPFFSSLATNTLVTIIDFNLPSTDKRLWTFDPSNGKLLFHSLVAHGRGSGDNIPCIFSNVPQSHQSSLGFYLTDQPYQGKHGYSLRLIGLENGINDKAHERAIVVHGAEYVSKHFIRQHGRLGRSHGCPAIPLEMVEPFINSTAGRSIIFVYHHDYPRFLANQVNKNRSNTLQM